MWGGRGGKPVFPTSGQSPHVAYAAGGVVFLMASSLPPLGKNPKSQMTCRGHRFLLSCERVKRLPA
jgi:hypothetical protein